MTRLAVAVVWLTGAGMLAGCAETRDSISSGIAQQAVGTSFGPKATQSADFVTASRPAQTNYMAVGVTPPPRSLKPKTKAEVAAIEAAAAAEANRAKAIGEATAAAGRRVTTTAPAPPPTE
jgi:hypothetical protein